MPILPECVGMLLDCALSQLLCSKAATASDKYSCVYCCPKPYLPSFALSRCSQHCHISLCVLTVSTPISASSGSGYGSGSGGVCNSIMREFEDEGCCNNGQFQNPECGVIKSDFNNFGCCPNSHGRTRRKHKAVYPDVRVYWVPERSAPTRVIWVDPPLV